MKKKIIGFILLAAGLVIIIISLGLWKVNIPFLATFKPLYISIAGAVIAIAGAFLAFEQSYGKQKEKEVPIYEGKKIVGYRISK